MPLSLNCPNCQKRFSVPDSAAGKNGYCPQCGEQIQVPGVPAPPEAPAPAPGAPPERARPIAEPLGAETGSASPSLADDGTKSCRFCGESILASAKKCKHCGEYLDAELARSASGGRRRDVRTRQEIEKAKKDITSAFWGSLLSFICCGIILAPLCMHQAHKSRKVLEQHGVTEKVGLATAALVIGGISFALNILGLIIQVQAGGRY